MTPIESPIERANAEQRAASDPKLSAFVAASAGSGKTKLLTDRLLRLMLAGTPPEKILCLTYTKAAAAEMAIRLADRLGKWVILPDEKLEAELKALDVPGTKDAQKTARKLFAEVLDLPGGMKIGTIHSFCQSVLRRFPLEASLSPHFTVEDESQATARLRESRETILATPGHSDAIAALAAESNELDFAALTSLFGAGSHNFGEDLLTTLPLEAVTAMQRASLAANEPDDAKILHQAVTTPTPNLAAALQKIAADGPANAAAAAAWRLEFLSQPEPARIAEWHQYAASYHGKEKPYLPSTLVGPSLLKKHPTLGDIMTAEQDRIKRIEDARKANALAHLNQHLLTLLRPILLAGQDKKTGLAAVTYADLIAHTLALLHNPDDIAWILYKLDGGIDHLLLDEVQDTAPAQWAITNAVAEEFFSGRGARETTRTIFAVGDPKQSIFSFQGADLASFNTNRQIFRQKVQNADQIWLDGTLSVSFRSTAPILKLVDAVFAAPPASDGVTPPNTMVHGLTRAGQAGRITLWPLTQPSMPSAIPPWAVPDTYESQESSKSVLASAIADHIHRTLTTGQRLESRNRPVTPGDFLILVRRRDSLVTAITAACKAQNIPIAGADRLLLTAQPAVTDILAFCDALLLPEDDLAFAHYLASPLGGLTDDSLMHLAMDRKSNLAETLFRRRAEHPDWTAANDFFHALLPKTDFLSPHALLTQILHTQGGRAKFFARLGPECAEPLDELLTESLTFAAQNPAALQTFLHALRASQNSIKREAEASGGMVRIMTVHGAKGLQAPIVILPDTTSLPKNDEKIFLLPVPQQDQTIPIFCPRAALRSDAIRTAAAAKRQANLEEYNRLLYVALTRAEDELLIAGAAGAGGGLSNAGKPPLETSWYATIKAGFQRLGITPDDHDIYTLTTPQSADPDRKDTAATPASAHLPTWTGAAPTWQSTPPPAETTRPEPLAPSRSADDPEKAAATSPLAGQFSALRAARQTALSKGRAIHALLQHLPDLPEHARDQAASKYLANAAFALETSAQSEILRAINTIFHNPTLAPLFGPGSRAEVPIAGVVADVEIGGLIDRLAITPSAIHIADYKTNRIPPTTPADIPTTYLRQLAAYAAILTEIHPALPIRCTLIWTETATPMPIPPELIARHAPTPHLPSPA
jgi:ATP-dependent helicase/nuclease subunit A